MRTAVGILALMTDAELTGLRERILAQERDLQFSRFAEPDAWALGTLLHDAAVADGHPVAISIRLNGSLLFYSALPGATPDNADWLRRKCAVVDRYHHASLYVGVDFALRGKTFEIDSRLPAADFAAHGGAFPIILRGTGVVGTVAVSGLPQREDHDLVVASLGSYLRSASQR